MTSANPRKTAERGGKREDGTYNQQWIPHVRVREAEKIARKKKDKV